MFTITPKFGPFPYDHVHPTTGEHLADIWKANRFMKQYLSEQLIIPK